MEEHLDSNMHPQEDSHLPENLEKDKLIHQHRGEELMRLGYPGDVLERKLGLKSLLIRCIFLILSLSAFSGQIQHATNRIMDPVWEYDQTYLEKTLINLGGSLFVLSVPKGFMEMAKTIEVEPSVVGSKAGSIKAGEILEPYIHIIDDIWDFLVLSTYLVIGQLAALKLVKLVAIKFFLGLGSLSCVIQYNRHTFFGKLGLTLILLFALTYAFYPLTLGIAAKTYESHQIETSTKVSENLGILKEQASDIELSFGSIKDDIKLIPKILGQGIKTTWDASVGLIVGLVLMFVLLPLLTLGTIFLIAKRALNYLDMPDLSDNLESSTKKIFNNIGSRRRLRLSNA
jgi:hypothetical protein